KCVVFPAKNDADLRELPEDIRKDLEIVAVDEVDQIIDKVLR
ncbi:MAG: hypothetical protein JRJ09_19015, partial [Deltaproteobacteria bacterium]|nr:hypothetical protein [Deltaproteobacteria bacterium]